MSRLTYSTSTLELFPNNVSRFLELLPGEGVVLSFGSFLSRKERAFPCPVPLDNKIECEYDEISSRIRRELNRKVHDETAQGIYS